MPIDFTAGATTFKNVNTGVLGDDYDQVMRLSNSLNKVRHFGKAWEVGDTGTVFYPFKWYANEAAENGGTFKPHVAAYYGHRVADFKAFGTTFIRSLSIIDENGEVVGEGDLAYQASKVAPLFVTAQKEQELARLSSNANAALGAGAYQIAYNNIINKYDAKSNKDAVRPFIERLSILKLTEVVYVLMDPNTHKAVFDDPKVQKTGRYTQEMSNARLLKLNNLANDVYVGILAQNPGLQPEHGKVYFLEVTYNYTSANASRTEAGKSDPQGVGQTATILFTTPENKDRLAELQARIPDTAAGILQHTYNMSPMSEDVLSTKMQAIMFETLPSLEFLPGGDKDRLVKSAGFFDTMHMVPSQESGLVDRMEQELGHKIGVQEPVKTGDAPTLQSIIDADGTPDFSKQSQAILDVEKNELEEMEELLGGAE